MLVSYPFIYTRFSDNSREYRVSSLPFLFFRTGTLLRTVAYFSISKAELSRKYIYEERRDEHRRLICELFWLRPRALSDLNNRMDDTGGRRCR